MTDDGAAEPTGAAGLARVDEGPSLNGFGLAVGDQDNRIRVAVSGELDIYTAPMLRERFVELLRASDNDIVVDLSGLTFVDSSGLSVLIGAYKRAKSAGGNLALASVPERIMKVLELTGLTRVFDIEP